MNSPQHDSSAAPEASPRIPRGAAQPHIVLLVADDLGGGDLGCYGSSDVRTPHLDRLAAESVKFERAFSASPTCSPSRSAIYTGLYPLRNGAHTNHSLVRDGLRTLPHYMRELGYRVVLAGKTHVGPRELFPFEYLANSNILPPDTGDVLHAELGLAAIDGLLATHDRRRPMCLVIGAHSPHVHWEANNGYDPAAVHVHPYLIDTQETREARCRYYTDVTKLDGEVGEIRASLARHGYADSTLLAFTTDHGAQFPFAKWNLYDAGIKAPLLVRPPGPAGTGVSTGAIVSVIDLLPTFIEAAGGTPPTGIDGQSFWPVLTGAAPATREEVYASHTGDRDWNRSPMRAVRTATHKYILNLRPDDPFTTHISKGAEGHEYWASWLRLASTDSRAAAVIARHAHRPAEELYDVQADPYELENLAADPAHARVLADLREKVARWRAQQGEPADKVLMPEDARLGPLRYAG